MVGLVGLEPTTPALSRQCSNQLSYRPKIFTPELTLRKFAINRMINKNYHPSCSDYYFNNR